MIRSFNRQIKGLESVHSLLRNVKKEVEDTREEEREEFGEKEMGWEEDEEEEEEGLSQTNEMNN